MTRVTVWTERRQDVEEDEVRAVYPDGIHAAIADGCFRPTMASPALVPLLDRLLLIGEQVPDTQGELPHGSVVETRVGRVLLRVQHRRGQENVHLDVAERGPGGIQPDSRRPRGQRHRQSRSTARRTRLAGPG